MLNELMTPHAAEMMPLLFRTVKAQMEDVVEGSMPDTRAPEQDIDSEAVRQFAREEGRREAALLLQQEMESRVLFEREHIASALDGFVTEKRRYFAGLEKEVVRLSLAIAERVLHRESCMDPTLLVAAARVALEQVDQESEAVLVVSPADAENWRTSLDRFGRAVTLREESSMSRGECLLQTASGSFEIGIRSQLCEIERGFFELMGRTPAIAA